MLQILLCASLPADKPKKCSKKAKSGDKVSVHYTGVHLLQHSTGQVADAMGDIQVSSTAWDS
jgi:hypothetical protein